MFLHLRKNELSQTHFRFLFFVVSAQFFPYHFVMHLNLNVIFSVFIVTSNRDLFIIFMKKIKIYGLLTVPINLQYLMLNIRCESHTKPFSIKFYYIKFTFGEGMEWTKGKKIMESLEMLMACQWIIIIEEKTVRNQVVIRATDQPTKRKATAI